MNRDKIEKEWQDEINNFLKKHNKIIKGMTPEEELEYVKKNELNKQIKEMQEKYKNKYKKLNEQGK